MSVTNPTALPTSDDAASTTVSADQLNGWLSTDDPASAAGASETVLPELEAERRRLHVAAGRARLQRDPAWLAVLSDGEQAAQRRGAEKIRRKQRDQHERGELARVRRERREQRAADRIADLETSDRVWQRRALARRARLADPTSRLAGVARVQVLTSAVLVALAAAGIAWTSTGVHDALVGPGGSPLAYAVEPLFSLPLVVIMLLHATAAKWGRTFPGPALRRRVLTLEAGLLAGTILINVSPVVPGLGTWQDSTVLLAHLAPPVLILVAVVLQPMAASFLAGLLADAHVETTGEAGSRLSEDTASTLSLLSRVRADVAAGELATGETGRPSTESIRKRYSVAKSRAQQVSDAWAIIGS